jgi:hypothetical protein
VFLLGCFPFRSSVSQIWSSKSKIDGRGGVTFAAWKWHSDQQRWMNLLIDRDRTLGVSSIQHLWGEIFPDNQLSMRR